MMWSRHGHGRFRRNGWGKMDVDYYGMGCCLRNGCAALKLPRRARRGGIKSRPRSRYSFAAGVCVCVGIIRTRELSGGGKSPSFSPRSSLLSSVVLLQVIVSVRGDNQCQVGLSKQAEMGLKVARGGAVVVGIGVDRGADGAGVVSSVVSRRGTVVCVRGLRRVVGGGRRLAVGVRVGRRVASGSGVVGRGIVVGKRRGSAGGRDSLAGGRHFRVLGVAVLHAGLGLALPEFALAAARGVVVGGRGAEAAFLLGVARDPDLESGADQE